MTVSIYAISEVLEVLQNIVVYWRLSRYAYDSNHPTPNKIRESTKLIKNTKLNRLVIHPNCNFRTIVRTGDLQFVKWCIRHGADYFDCGLLNACERGYLEIAKLMISHGADDWDGGLYFACKSGHLDLANLMIERGANWLDGGLIMACSKGHTELVKLMISQGASYCNSCNNKKHPELQFGGTSSKLKY